MVVVGGEASSFRAIGEIIEIPCYKRRSLRAISRFFKVIPELLPLRGVGVGIKSKYEPLLIVLFVDGDLDDLVCSVRGSNSDLRCKPRSSYWIHNSRSRKPHIVEKVTHGTIKNFGFHKNENRWVMGFDELTHVAFEGIIARPSAIPKHQCERIHRRVGGKRICNQSLEDTTDPSMILVLGSYGRHLD